MTLNNTEFSPSQHLSGVHGLKLSSQGDLVVLLTTPSRSQRASVVEILHWEAGLELGTTSSWPLPVCNTLNLNTTQSYMKNLHLMKHFTQKWRFAETHPQKIQDIDELVSSSEQIWRNVAVNHLLTNGPSAVNGRECKQLIKIQPIASELKYESSIHNKTSSSETVISSESGEEYAQIKNCLETTTLYGLFH